MISYFRDEAEKVTTDPHDYPASVDGQGATGRPSPRREGGLGSLVPCHGYDNSQDSEDGFSYAVRQTAYGPPPPPPTPALRASGALVPLCTAALSQPGR